MRRGMAISFLFVLIALFVSCDNQEKGKDKIKNHIEVKPKKVDKYEFGILVNDFKVEKNQIKKDETFSQILLKYNVNYSTINKLVEKSKGVFNIRSFQRGKNYTIIFEKDSLSKAKVFIYQPNLIEYVVYDFRDSLQVYKGEKEVIYREREVSGIINSSLSEALDKQGIDYRVSNSLSEIYAWTVDFFRIQKGDFFRVIYDEKYIDDTLYVGIGEIKAAEFNSSGESFYSFYYEGDEFPGYYDEQGKNLRKAFLKAPLKFGTFRISSRYSGKRYHPVLHRFKSHLGTDYAAPTGTPIISTANGTVTKSEYNKNNGHYVKIRHNATYSTQYLHMSKRAVKVGQTIRQGQVIGYVGQTGLASGPHVCYRFWKNGVQVDPLRQKLPDVKPMSKEIISDYQEFIKPLKSRLDRISLPVEFEAKKINENEYIISSED